MLNNKDRIIDKIGKIFKLISKSTLKPDLDLIESVKHFSSKNDIVEKQSKCYKEFIIALIEYRRLTKESDNKNSQESNNEIISDSNRDNTYADIVKHLNQNWVSNNPQLYKEIVLEAVKEDGWALEYVDHMILSSTQYKKIARAAVKENEHALQYVNKDWILNNFDKYEEIARVAVNKNTFVLQYVNKDWAVENPKPYYQIVRAAVKKNGLALQFASDELRNDPKMVIAAMRENKNALKYCLFVKYNEILQAAIREYGINILTYVNKDWAVENPKPYYQIVREAVIANKGYLQGLSYADEQNNEIVQAIVSVSGAFLTYINDDFKSDPGILKLAVNQDPGALKYVNKDWAAENRADYIKIVREAAKKDLSVLKHVKHYISHDVYIKIVRELESQYTNDPALSSDDVKLLTDKDYYKIFYKKCPEFYYNYKINEAWALQNFEKYYNFVKGGMAFQYVNQNWALKCPIWYKEVAQAAVKKDGNALEYINEKWALSNTEEYYNIALEAVTKDGNALKYLHHIVLSFTQYKKIALEAVKKDGNALKYLDHIVLSPKQYKKIALAGVKKNGNALKYVNKDWAVENPEQYYEIVLVAVEREPIALSYSYVQENSCLFQKEVYNEIVLEAVKGLLKKIYVLSDSIRFLFYDFSSQLKDFEDKSILISLLINLRDPRKDNFKGFKLLKITTIISSHFNIVLYTLILSSKYIAYSLKKSLFEVMEKEKRTFNLSDSELDLYKNLLKSYLEFYSSGDYKTNFSEEEKKKLEQLRVKGLMPNNNCNTNDKPFYISEALKPIKANSVYLYNMIKGGVSDKIKIRNNIIPMIKEYHFDDTEVILIRDKFHNTLPAENCLKSIFKNVDNMGAHILELYSDN